MSPMIMKCLFTTKSCTALSCCNVSSLGPLLCRTKPVVKRNHRDQRMNCSSESDPRQEYLHFKQQMLKRFYERQSRLQETFAKLGVKRDTTDATSQSFDVCSSSPSYAESDVKINCIRATPSLQDNSLAVAADRMAQGGIAKLETRMREKQKQAKRLADRAMLTECIPMYKE